jgi:hypothetical protein
MRGALAAFALLAAVPGFPGSAQPGPAATFSQREIHDYASALFKVLTVKRTAELRWKTASPAERAELRKQAQAAIEAVLARYGFTEASFNQLSGAIEHQPALRRQVRQMVMREGLGY